MEEERNPPETLICSPEPQISTPEPNYEPILRSGTYVVQVPKDQIYRVPPPDQAALAHHRLKSKRPSRCCCCCCSFCTCLIIFIIVVVLLVALIAGIVVIFVQKENPKFKIEHISMKIRKNQWPEYEIKLKVKNLNEHKSFLFDEGGRSFIYSRQKEIATGNFPVFNQGPENSTLINVVFRGSNVVLPKNKNISLSVEINLTVKLKIGMLKTGSDKIGVSCSLRVDSLGTRIRILSQQCHTTNGNVKGLPAKAATFL